ncbi:MAG: hypothetical protein CYPHOPRED_002779 [Cyphobasidiales sp. Tagirdzhanova-0007]|nr:MAG: hypothetical protein CYPHOPRED_002779 [Cyphobasidiales sp. Tagirdzhanova-0007]
MPATPESLTDNENENDSDFTQSLNTSPRTKTTITNTTTRSSSGNIDHAQGSSTTIQYSGASSVTQAVGEDGVLILRPVASRADRKVKVKKVISFTPRLSHFDRLSPTSQGDMFRGFYVLFWLLMGLTILRVLYHSWLQSGDVVGMRFAKLISEDAIALGISDALLVGSTVICVPYIQASLVKIVLF